MCFRLLEVDGLPHARQSMMITIRPGGEWYNDQELLKGCYHVGGERAVSAAYKRLDAETGRRDNGVGASCATTQLASYTAVLFNRGVISLGIGDVRNLL